MPDNDPKYTRKNSSRGTLKAKRNSTSWQVQRVDLNPIELVWDELGQKGRAKQPTRAAHLWQLLQESCAELSSVYQQSLVEEMPRNCETVIAAKGAILVNQKFKILCVFFVLICI